MADDPLDGSPSTERGTFWYPEWLGDIHCGGKPLVATEPADREAERREEMIDDAYQAARE